MTCVYVYMYRYYIDQMHTSLVTVSSVRQTSGQRMPDGLCGYCGGIVTVPIWRVFGLARNLACKVRDMVSMAAFDFCLQRSTDH